MQSINTSTCIQKEIHSLIRCNISAKEIESVLEKERGQYPNDVLKNEA